MGQLFPLCGLPLALWQFVELLWPSTSLCLYEWIYERLRQILYKCVLPGRAVPKPHRASARGSELVSVSPRWLGGIVRLGDLAQVPYSPKPGCLAILMEVPCLLWLHSRLSQVFQNTLQNHRLPFPLGNFVHRALLKESRILPPAKLIFPALHSPLVLKRVKPGNTWPGQHPFIGSFCTLEISCLFCPVLIIWQNIFYEVSQAQTIFCRPKDTQLLF